MSFSFKPTGKELDFEILPEGVYHCIVSNISDEENKQGTGKYIKLTLVVSEGNNLGYKLTDYINYEHQNEIAANIGKKTLAAISRALFDEIKEFTLDELMNKFLQVTVKNKADQNGTMRNNIVKYSKSTIETPF